MIKKSINYICASLILGLVAQSAWANLLINPTRVEFTPSDRTADVTLINTSKFTTTYRLEWAEKKAKVNGGYRVNISGAIFSLWLLAAPEDGNVASASVFKGPPHTTTLENPAERGIASSLRARK